MRRMVRLTEGDLHRLVERSVRRCIREGIDDDDFDTAGGDVDIDSVISNLEAAYRELQNTDDTSLLDIANDIRAILGDLSQY